MFGAIYFLLKEGIRWRLLSQTQYAFAPWESVYSRWRLWTANGFLQDLLKLVAKPKGKLRFLDASHIKVHQDACRHGGGFQARCIGKTKGGLNTKATAVVDASGRVVAFCLAPGNRHDIKAMKDITAHLKLCKVVADRGYDSTPLRRELESMGCLTCIPTRKNRKVQIPVHQATYQKRHLVENAFQRLKRWRRLGIRYEKLECTFLSALTCSFLVDWIIS